MIVFYFFDVGGASPFKEKSIYFRYLAIVLYALGMVVLIEVGTRIMVYVYGGSMKPEDSRKKLYSDLKNKHKK